MHHHFRLQLIAQNIRNIFLARARDKRQLQPRISIVIARPAPTPSPDLRHPKKGHCRAGALRASSHERQPPLLRPLLFCAFLITFGSPHLCCVRCDSILIPTVLLVFSFKIVKKNREEINDPPTNISNICVYTSVTTDTSNDYLCIVLR